MSSSKLAQNTLGSMTPIPKIEGDTDAKEESEHKSDNSATPVS